ncbi:hypothetical protein [Halorientalis salina]|uniref:hypothetical protein n=1 Tax=Halorientalis salina TaxID=2932266 RepID=UPI0010AB9906|nr:hypothetical protein [Halorientalis salina]
MPSVVVIGNAVAKNLATGLDESATVTFASSDDVVVRQATASGLDAHCVDVTDAGSLCPVAEGSDTAIVVLEPERTALLAANLLRSSCGIDDVVAVVSEPTYLEAFDATDIELLDTRTWLLDAVQEQLPHLRTDD